MKPNTDPINCVQTYGVDYPGRRDGNQSLIIERQGTPEAIATGHMQGGRFFDKRVKLYTSVFNEGLITTMPLKPMSGWRQFLVKEKS
eukprot:CAMPEP_0170479372 /NCGR_PEP_ID=MMETSP0208-20121228/637_1 /TAXON_ID=197538 /ORGANISM="Strombidium inclinatum, Strain S3" /LENGTH=86 /DNA_ID=CAMNT_0010751755 /DNA_START=232 /DNA_END=492 /DNA_ORIENTATION=-